MCKADFEDLTDIYTVNIIIVSDARTYFDDVQ